MGALSNWPWMRTLAMSAVGEVVQVDRILFGTIQDHCWELGIESGDVLECVENHPDSILVRLSDGDEKTVLRDYAWFITVEEVRKRAS